MWKEVFQQYAADIKYPGAARIGLCKAGKIYSAKLDPLSTIGDSVMPEKLITYLGAEKPNAVKYRRGVEQKMIRNSPNRFPMIGKPSSAFVMKDLHGRHFLHYLVESHGFQRGEKVLHAFMVEFDESSGRNQYHPANLFNRHSLWSGHVANLTTGFSNDQYHHLCLLDRFHGDNPNVNEDDRATLDILHGNGILPVTSDGYLIS